MSTKKLTLNLQEGDPPTLHPHKGVDLRSRCLFLALNEPLMRRQPNGSLAYAAAEKVTIDESQTVYTFRMRPQQWSDGKPLDSSHFAQAWRSALEPNSLCAKTDIFYPIKNAQKVKKGEMPVEALGISTPDPQTLVVELEHPTPYFLDLTATSFFAPLYTIANEEPTHFNGPFIVGEWVHDQKLVLHPNPHYWDKESVQLEEVCFTMVKDPMTAFVMYEQGDLDLVGDPFSSLPFDAIPALAQSGKLKSKLISRIFYVVLNTNSPPLHVPALRRALSLSIDRNALTQHLFFGEEPSISLLPKTLSVYSEEELHQMEEDPVVLFEQALAELNLTRETFPKLVFNYANLSGQKSLSEFIQDQWKKKLGIDVDLVCSDWNLHAANLKKKNYQIGTIHLTTLYQDPMFYLDLFRDKTSFSNYAAWESPDYQLLLKQSEKTLDPHIRLQYLRAAEGLLLKEMPTISLFTQNLQYLVKPGIQLEISDLGIYDFKKTRILPAP